MMFMIVVVVVVVVEDTLSSNNPTFPAVSGLGILAFITLPSWVHPPETTSRRSTLIYRPRNGHDIIVIYMRNVSTIVIVFIT